MDDNRTGHQPQRVGPRVAVAEVGERKEHRASQPCAEPLRVVGKVVLKRKRHFLHLLWLLLLGSPAAKPRGRNLLCVRQCSKDCGRVTGMASACGLTYDQQGTGQLMQCFQR